MSLVAEPPAESLADLVRAMTSTGRRKGEKVIYYRRPQFQPKGNPDPAPGWIVWADSQVFKQIHYLERGWTPLPKYGQVQKLFRADAPAGSPDSYGPWGPILSHPDGPGEFPVEQILTYRWYDPSQCPVPGVRFPQLQAWVAEGNEIVEYPCPECNGRSYLDAIFLARHCRNAHEYDRAEILALGEQLGIDFRRIFRKSVRRIPYAAAEESVAAEPAPAPRVPVKQIVTRSAKRERTPEEKEAARLHMARVRAGRKANEAA